MATLQPCLWDGPLGCSRQPGQSFWIASKAGRRWPSSSNMLKSVALGLFPTTGLEGWPTIMVTVSGSDGTAFLFFVFFLFLEELLFCLAFCLWSSPLGVSLLDQLLKLCIGSQAGVSDLHLPTNHVDNGQGSGPQLQVLLAIVVGYQALGNHHWLLVLKLDLHSGGNLNHGFGLLPPLGLPF